MIKYFEGNPTRGSLKILDEGEKYSVFYYKFDGSNIKVKDLKQILQITEQILGSLDTVALRFEPIAYPYMTVYLCIKNRSDIELGTYRL